MGLQDPNWSTTGGTQHPQHNSDRSKASNWCYNPRGFKNWRKDLEEDPQVPRPDYRSRQICGENSNTNHQTQNCEKTQ